MYKSEKIELSVKSITIQYSQILCPPCSNVMLCSNAMLSHIWDFYWAVNSRFIHVLKWNVPFTKQLRKKLHHYPVGLGPVRYMTISVHTTSVQVFRLIRINLDHFEKFHF